MDVMEKLVELIEESGACFDCFPVSGYENNQIEKIASHLIDNCVTVQEWYYASNQPKEDGTYLVQTNTGTITTARFYAFKSFPATKYLPAVHRHASWQSNRNVVKWTFLPRPPKGE